MTYKLVAFDLDGTLAESKSPISDEMVEMLEKLLTVAQVCVITGGGEKQLRSQVADRLTTVKGLHLMPTCGTRYLIRNKSHWAVQYSEDISTIDSRNIARTIQECAEDLGLWESRPYGQIIERRGSQVTFSALGQDAPLNEKLAWDPDGSKKIMLRDAVAEKLPNFEVRCGGSTSLDITRSGVDKAYGIRKLSMVTGISTSEMLFIGDRLDFNGNDYPVISTGATCIEVSSPDETLGVINNLINNVLKEN